jgi:hypothetical protein
MKVLILNASYYIWGQELWALQFFWVLWIKDPTWLRDTIYLPVHSKYKSP